MIMLLMINAFIYNASVLICYINLDEAKILSLVILMIFYDYFLMIQNNLFLLMFLDYLLATSMDLIY